MDRTKWEDAAGSWNCHAGERYATAKRKRMGPRAQSAEKVSAKGSMLSNQEYTDSQALETGQVLVIGFEISWPLSFPICFSSFEKRKHLTAVCCLSHHCISGEDNLFPRSIDIEEFLLGWLILTPHPCLTEMMRFGILILCCNELKVWGMLGWMYIWTAWVFGPESGLWKAENYLPQIHTIILGSCGCFRIKGFWRFDYVKDILFWVILALSNHKYPDI